MSAPEAVPTPDFAVVARKPLERRLVVEYVLNTPELQETDYLEWKTAYDLSTRPGAAATAKHLIGFANRDFQQAARHADGHAYLLLGVEPGNLAGVPDWDSADVQQWLERFTGTGLRYDLHYVTTAGKKVMFLTVDRPKPGDPIFCMQAASSEAGSSKSLPEAAIFVRRNGRTDVASAEDVRRLAERAGGAAAELELGLTLDGSKLVPLPAEKLTTTARDIWLQEEQDDLLASLPPPPSAWSIPSPTLALERRTEEEFQREVAAYISDAMNRWPGIVASEHIEEVGSTFSATVVNTGPDNYIDVVVELTLPVPESWVYVEPEDAQRYRPERPDAFGGRMFLAPALALSPGAFAAAGTPRPQLERVDDKHTLVRFPPMHVRPHTSHATAEVSLLVLPEGAGTTVDVEWRITASNRSGQVAGTAGLTVPGQAPAAG